MLDVKTRKNSLFVIVNKRVFEYSVFGDSEVLNIRFTAQQKPLCFSEEFNDILSFITTDLQTKKTLKILCSAFYTNKRAVEKLFRENVGMTFHEYMTELRLGTAIALLFSPKITVSEIAKETGFSSSQNFSKFFSKNLSLSPSEFRAALQERVFETMSRNRLSAFGSAGLPDGFHLYVHSPKQEENPVKSTVSVTPPPPKIRVLKDHED